MQSRQVFVTVSYLYRSSPSQPLKRNNLMMETTVETRQQAVKNAYHYFIKFLNTTLGKENWFLDKLTVTGDGISNFWA